ncbi:MAG: class I SAM-dependent DNA methyltransferase, partial [Gammaproteobacteria bacterium]
MMKNAKKRPKTPFRQRQPHLAARGAGIDWQIVRERAGDFAKKWKNETSESAEAQTFWNDFFEVFGRTRRGLAFYEFQAKRAATGFYGHIDLLWPDVLAVEHKSAGKSLDDGEKQLSQYIGGLPDGVEYGLVCNFQYFRLFDYKQGKTYNFSLAQLSENAEKFEFFIAHEREMFSLELKASQDAAKLMGNLYDALIKSGYRNETSRLLIRLLFCMFAEDTGIFTPRSFQNYILSETKEDGSDLGMHLGTLFETLNSADARRQTTLPEKLRAFPFVNGDLFNGQIGTANFGKETRNIVLEACGFDWSEISPAIFGSLFQSVADPQQRRAAGEHYTSEENILKVIRPLFLDELQEEYNRAGGNKRALRTLHAKIAKMRFLDPACGCGNFLIIAYRELRRLEIEIISRLKITKPGEVRAHCRVSVANFYGMEINEFPANIAQGAMWLVEHQMNRQLSEMTRCNISSIPLTISAHIANKNALLLDWEKFVAPEKLSYILGNPPFVDRKGRSDERRQEMALVFNGMKTGNLDYVSAWYAKAIRYIRGHSIRCAFVSTDSITQSMQAAVLWKILYGENIKIHFAYRPFKWYNEAKGVAQVRVVIIGFGDRAIKNPVIYDSPDAKGKARKIAAKNINAYLMDMGNILIAPRRAPICNAPAMASGSNPIDNGHLLFSNEEKLLFLRNTPEASAFFRPVIGGEGVLKGVKRWCLWLADSEPSAFNKIKPVMARVKQTKQFRLNSGRGATEKLAKTPHLFGEIRQPNKKYLVVPQTSSGERPYIPLEFAAKRFIALIKCQIIPNASMFHFGVLSSAMHMAWTRATCGRLGGGYSYTASLVYNTFPWPQNAAAPLQKKIAACAQKVLDARKNFNEPLGELYS